MNTIAGFGLCTLSDKELIKKVDELCDDLYKNGKIPLRHIPARPDEDFDLLIGELLLRYKKKIEDYKPEYKEHKGWSGEGVETESWFKEVEE